MNRLVEARAEFEKWWLFDLLVRHKGNVPTAAKAARINRTDMYKYLKKYGLKPTVYSSEVAAYKPTLVAEFHAWMRKGGHPSMSDRD